MGTIPYVFLAYNKSNTSASAHDGNGLHLRPTSDVYVKAEFDNYLCSSPGQTAFSGKN